MCILKSRRERQRGGAALRDSLWHCWFLNGEGLGRRDVCAL